MSRTDKTDPWWVVAEWWEPCHDQCPEAGRRVRECDLPAEPVVRHPGRRYRFGRGCEWVPAWPDRIRDVRTGPPAWFVDHVWTSRTRARVRDDCRRAVKEYRATGEVDVVPPVDQHRHGAAWLWW